MHGPLVFSLRPTRPHGGNARTHDQRKREHRNNSATRENAINTNTRVHQLMMQMRVIWPTHSLKVTIATEESPWDPPLDPAVNPNQEPAAEPAAGLRRRPPIWDPPWNQPWDNAADPSS